MEKIIIEIEATYGAKLNFRAIRIVISEIIDVELEPTLTVTLV